MNITDAHCWCGQPWVFEAYVLGPKYTGLREDVGVNLTQVRCPHGHEWRYLIPKWVDLQREAASLPPEDGRRWQAFLRVDGTLVICEQLPDIDPDSELGRVLAEAEREGAHP